MAESYQDQIEQFMDEHPNCDCGKPSEYIIFELENDTPVQAVCELCREQVMKGLDNVYNN